MQTESARPGVATRTGGEQVDETGTHVTVLDAAQYMRNLGCYVFTLDHPGLPVCSGVPTPNHNPATCTERGKHPTGKWSIEATSKQADVIAMFAGTLRNYGIDCRASRLLVIDEDVLGAFTAYAEQHDHTIPRTFVVRSGRPGGGRHFYFRVPQLDSPFTNATGDLPKGVDVRGVGGYVVGPGSVHASGAVYWPEDWAAPIANLPVWLAEALSRKNTKAVPPVDGEPLDRPVPPRVVELLEADPGDRSERFYRIVRELLEAGFTQGQAVTVLAPWCDQHEKYVGRVEIEVARCWSKPGGTAVTAGTSPLAAGATAQLPAPSAGELTDARMASTVCAVTLGERFCWTGALGWMGWDGQVWTRSDEAAVIEVVRLFVVDKFAREVQAGADSDRRKALSGLLNRGRIGAIASLARGILRQNAADFDQNPDLLNTLSGVVNLRTKALMPHDRALLFTKITAVGYRPGATHPDWATALEALPADVRDWYQVRMGQAITGHMTPDDLLVVNHGGGENGKTTVLGVASRALGGFYVLVSDRVLLANPDAHPTELMELRGARLGLIEETPEARRLSVARLKKVVGTPEIEARYIRQDSVTFRATHSLFLSTNYRPVVEETDHGTWRRLALVRFPYRFVTDKDQPLQDENERRGDANLRDRVLISTETQEAALAWMVDGAYQWYQAARVMPPIPEPVRVDTRAWRTESDLVLAYVDERLIPDAARHVVSTELLADFNDWLMARGHQKWADKMFTSRFGEHDEVTRHRIVKRQIRPAGGVSRATTGGMAPILTALPSRYIAWLGVRFATNADFDADQEKQSLGKPVAGVASQAPMNSYTYSHGMLPEPGLPPLPLPPAEPAPGVEKPRQCTHWIGAEGRQCQIAKGLRLFTGGLLCPHHAPSSVGPASAVNGARPPAPRTAPEVTTTAVSTVVDPNYCPRCQQTYPNALAWSECDRCGTRTHSRGRGGHGATCQTCLTERTSA